jgi:flagellin-like hook-associated protein FlgL
MCGATVLALAAIAEGVRRKDQAYQNSLRDQRGYTSDHQDRLDRLSNQAHQKQTGTQNLFAKDNVEGDMLADQIRMKKLLDQNMPTSAPPVLPGPKGAPAIFENADQVAMDRELGRVDDQATNLMALRAFGSALQGLQPELMRTQENTRRLGNFMKGEGNVYGLEMAEAEQNAYSPMGDLLVTMGSAGLGGSLKKPRNVS